MRALYLSKFGGPRVLEEGEVHEPIAEDDQVLIRVAAAGVNREDLFRLAGFTVDFDTRKDTSPYLGYECSGVVIHTGSKVSTCKKGDKVCAFLLGGGYAEVVAVPATFVVVVPSGIPLIYAASLPQATCLTLWCFTMLRKITRGQKILIHGGAGGVGSIAIQYAKWIGCDVFATAGNERKVQICQELGAKLCINYKKEDFCKRVKRETEGKGVDIIVDVAGAGYFKKNLNCLSIGGSLILIGYKTGNIVDIDLQLLRRKNISVLGAALALLGLDVIPMLLSKAVHLVWPLIASGHIKPVIGKVFNFSQAADALTTMGTHALPGKILLIP